MTGPSLDERCVALGILPAYRDYTGHMRRSPDSTLEALLKRLSSPARTSPLPPVFVLRADAAPTSIPILQEQAANGHLRWEIETDKGDRLAGNVEGQEQAIPVSPSLPTGDHRLRLFAENSTASIAECRLIVTPSRAFLPSSLQGEGRVWGFAIQLFALRSPHNWGIGDFTDLSELIGHAASLGAGIIGLNPLHALFPDQPDRASPYSPSSRNFLNFIYIDPLAIPEFGECEEAQDLWKDRSFQSELAALRATELVDYERVAACKLRILKLLYLDFRERHFLLGDAYGEEFRYFQRSNDGDLRLLATFQTLRLHLAARSPHHQPWWDWPIQFRHPSSPAILEFIQAHETEIEFFEYQQWHARRQLRHCTERAQKAGMPIGLYQDIAIGVDRDSPEAWSSQDYLVDDWSIGAPPDDWNALGQNWGTPPPHPRRMAETGYAAFRRSLRANMQAAGAVRIDHALGLMRLFWIPNGATAADGAYVLYPLEQLLAVIALESQNSRCLVIGEDLGTVPEGLQDALASAGILSYRLLYFERDENGGFRSPGAWPAQALAAAGTHDLPTFPGYWRGADIDLKDRLGLYAAPDVAQNQRKRREDDLARLVEMLRAEGLDVDTDGAPIEAIYRHLARTPSKILMVQLEDLLAVTEQVNLPGTTDQHPNWRRKLPKTIAEIFSDANVVGIAAAIQAERGNVAAGGTQ
jgi:(1->4)-alpha-D-glucan 1-alpha-D-glucosylmutase